MARTRGWRGEVIHTVGQVQELEEKARVAAESVRKQLRRAVREDGLTCLSRLKFERLGCSPVEDANPLSVFEQANQTFTWLVALKGVRYLLRHHPEAKPFHVAYPTQGGSDIRSDHLSQVAAEVFAKMGTDWKNKVKIDIVRLRQRSRAKKKYVFFCTDTLRKPCRHRQFESGRIEVRSVKV